MGGSEAARGQGEHGEEASALQLFQIERIRVVTIKDMQIENLTAIYRMALGLERWFPNNNSVFAYGTRLCEETGELVEALIDIHDSGINDESKHHLVKEIEDVLQVITGILGIYRLNERLPKDLSGFKTAETQRLVTKNDIITISVCAGQFADAINYMESQGIKKQKRGNNPDERLLETARSFICQIMLFLQQYDLMSDLEEQIKKDYLTLADEGFIELTS